MVSWSFHDWGVPILVRGDIGPNFGRLKSFAPITPFNCNIQHYTLMYHTTFRPDRGYIWGKIDGWQESER